MQQNNDIIERLTRVEEGVKHLTESNARIEKSITTAAANLKHQIEADAAHNVDLRVSNASAPLRKRMQRVELGLALAIGGFGGEKILPYLRELLK
jgi:hypothetical protein